MANQINKLEYNTIESLLYVGYYKQKAQNDLIKFISNGKKINLSPYTKCRERMHKSGDLAHDPNFQSLRNIPFKTSSQAFIDYLNTKSQERETTKGDKHKLTLKDLDYVKFIVDSDYFRDTFFSEWFFKNGYGTHRHIIRKNQKGRYEVDNAMQYMEIVLSAIILQSMHLYKDFKVYYVTDQDRILKNYNSFDSFLESHFEKLCDSGLHQCIKDSTKINNALKYLGVSDSDLCYSTNDSRIVKEALDCLGVHDNGLDKDEGCEEYIYKNIVFNGVFTAIPRELILKLGMLLDYGSLLTYAISYQWDD